jgi:predicted Fe-Mo cluster-binding NifX family protein
MKYAIPMNQKEKTSLIAPILGRAKYFAIYDTELKETKYIENPGVTQAKGAGNLAAQTLVELGIDKVITTHIGPNAQNALEAGEVEIAIENGLTLKEVIDKYSK